MSDSTGAASHVHSGTGAVAAGTGAAKAAGAGSHGGGGGEADRNTKIGSLEELKEKAPKVYDAMMLSLAQMMCSQMNRSNQRLKKMIREGQRRD